ncbi:hypothetical protein CFC21_050904 [Triticum aestivum]|uniref:Uncharacterized protein n=4 Tax=Triticum TaxID=4564 RepID=A0A9R0S2E2_TRITD|nr:hypothetical protein TRIUR3_09834 [Triticum urartu]KAF7041068.1 hypothetical protein CFC21_050904 [Triticum aestivum]VAH87117.1 unnamed protein product [Triticum turgidum subsp. durum]
MSARLVILGGGVQLSAYEALEPGVSGDSGGYQVGRWRASGSPLLAGSGGPDWLPRWQNVASLSSWGNVELRSALHDSNREGAVALSGGCLVVRGA